MRDPLEYNRMATAVNPYGDGRAAERTVEAQLAEWSSYDDLRVFVQHKRPQSLALTYQGRLHLNTTGVGGYSLYAPDWTLGPLDSTSVLRGIALNLGNWHCSWQRGNGVFGARCNFERREAVVQLGNGGEVIAMNGIVETLSIAVDDPFETMRFL